MIYIVMGVSGVGKSTVGTALAAALDIKFAEGDGFHSAENVAKMESGRPLDDSDRKPWLASIAKEIENTIRTGDDLIVTCSALKRDYRAILAVERELVCFIHLKGSPQTIERRLNERIGHYMPPHLLQSQFDTLEPLGPDENFIEISIDQPVEAIVRDITGKIGR